MTALLSLTVLGMDGVSWKPLNPTRNLIPSVSTVMTSAPTAVAPAPVALTLVIIVSATVSLYVVYASVFQLTALSMTNTSSSLARLPGLSSSEDLSTGFQKVILTIKGIIDNDPEPTSSDISHHNRDSRKKLLHSPLSHRQDWRLSATIPTPPPTYCRSSNDACGPTLIPERSR